MYQINIQIGYMWYELSFHFYYLMDCETHFFKKLKQIQSKPRGGGYKDHTKLIQKLIDLKLWNTMAERKLLLEELKLFVPFSM